MASHPAGMAIIFLRQRGDVQQYNIYTSTAAKGQSLNTSLLDPNNDNVKLAAL